ncbi:centrosomal protein 89kDa [Leptinotarsa decemlineata]|uniref:centrosomal protein 89kDa n=1 Tax=Leptinotarsa decemlineata TaxID=7539 RepID=UPI003D308B15
MNDVPVKPRRKKVDVPVHYGSGDQKKSFSANFHSGNYCRGGDHEPIHTEIVVEIPESDKSAKISRRHLAKENARLEQENKELFMKFHELEDLSVRKICKLREKTGSLQSLNASLEKENNELKALYQNLLFKFNDVNDQLEASKFCKSCEDLKITVEKYSADNSFLRTGNKELAEDLDMLKTVVYRLNVQLERYQEVLRRNKINIPSPPQADGIQKRDTLYTSWDDISKEILSDVHRNHKHTPISWGSVNKHTLGPLLDAYEDTIKEKEEIIQNYEREMYKFTGKLREIIKENESLFSRLTEDEGCSSKLKSEVTKLKAELKSTREQNDVLIKKCSIKQDKVEEILKVYEAKVEQMRRDFEVLHGEFIKCRAENAALKEKAKSLVDSQEDYKNQMQNFIPLAVHTSSVNECKKWYEELKLQYENEKDKLLKRIESQTRTIEELNKEIIKHRNTKDGLEAKVVQLDKHIKKLETKHLELEHTLNEVQLSRSALRKQLHKAMGFAKEMVAEQETLLRALNQRQLENKAVRKLGCDMATKMDSLKNQLKDVQKSAWQEFTTVEQTIQEQAHVIETMKEDYEKEIENLKKVIKEQEETNLILKNEVPMTHYHLYKDKYK